MTGIRKIGGYGCQKVLPLTYDESLSYYEAICKLTTKINEVIGVIDDGLESLIREQLDKLFVDAMYDEETETLILVLGIKE